MLNVRHRRLALTTSALACLAALPLAARAQATPAFLSGSAILSNVSVTLVDLDPNDGIAPGLTLNDARGFLNIKATAALDLRTVTPDYQGSVLPGSPASVFDAHSVAMATQDGLTQSAGRSFAQALEVASIIPAAGGGTLISGISLDRLSLLGSVDPTYGYPVPTTFSLTPHTALVIDGQSALSRTIDTTELREWATANGYEGYSLRDTAQIYSFAIFLPSDVSFDEFDLLEGILNSPDSVFALTVDASPDLLTLDDPVVNTLHDSRSFSIRFDNTGDTDLSGQFVLSAGVTSDATIYLTKPTTAVPEPGAFALMALGLSGLWLARRKKG